jgi:hypothetical protein
MSRVRKAMDDQDAQEEALSDHEVDRAMIVRYKRSEEMLAADGSKWRLTFDDGLMAETIRVSRGSEEWWEVRVIEPYKMHLCQRFKDHNQAYRFLLRRHIE